MKKTWHAALWWKLSRSRIRKPICVSNSYIIIYENECLNIHWVKQMFNPVHTGGCRLDIGWCYYNSFGCFRMCYAMNLDILYSIAPLLYSDSLFLRFPWKFVNLLWKWNCVTKLFKFSVILSFILNCLHHVSQLNIAFLSHRCNNS